MYKIYAISNTRGKVHVVNSKSLTEAVDYIYGFRDAWIESNEKPLLRFKAGAYWERINEKWVKDSC